MNGLKLYALLGGFTIATLASPHLVIAADVSTAGSSTKTETAFDETHYTGDRGIRLDQLFTMFNEKVASANKSAAVPTTTAKPRTVAQVQQKAPAKVASKSKPVVVAKKSVRDITKYIKPSDDAHLPNQLAVFKPEGGNNIQAVSHSSAGNDSPVLTASLNRPGTIPKYKAGEQMVIKLNALKDCNVIVFDYDSKGTLTQIFPNEFEPSGKLNAGQQIELGGSDAKYTLDVAGKGMERIFVYAYPADDKQITVAYLSPVADTPFRSTPMTPAQYKDLVQKSRSYDEVSMASGSRSVTVKAKVQPAAQLTSSSSDKAANKVELVFQIDK